MNLKYLFSICVALAAGMPTARAVEAPPAAPPPFTLAEAIHTAWEMNPDLEVVEHHLAAAEQGLELAHSEYYPRLAFLQEAQESNNPVHRFSSLLNQGLLTQGSLFNPPGSVSNFHTQFRLSYDINTGGLRGSRMRGAQAEVESTDLNVTTVKNLIAYQVAEAYYRLFQSQQVLKVREEGVKVLEAQRKDVKSRLKNDSALRTELLQVELRQAEAQDALVRAHTARSLAWAVMENAVGSRIGRRRLPETVPVAPWEAHVDKIEKAVHGLAEAEVGSATPDAASVEAMGSRPEIEESEWRVHSAEAALHGARAGNRPLITAVSTYDIFSGDLSQPNDSYFIGLAVSLKLFDAGKTRASMRKAREDLAALSARHRRVQLDVELDVRRAVIQLREARERLKLSASAVTQADENLRETEARRKNELATATQVLDAHLLVTDATVRQTNALADLEVARAGMERAVGRIASFLAQE